MLTTVIRNKSCVASAFTPISQAMFGSEKKKVAHGYRSVFLIAYAERGKEAHRCGRQLPY